MSVDSGPPAGHRAVVVWSAVGVGAALVAATVIAVWTVTRPSPDVGQPLEVLRSGSPVPSDARLSAPRSTADSYSGEGSAGQSSAEILPRPQARDASLDSLPAAASPPVRLRAADLGVDASIVPVGVEQDGSMTIPASPTTVGWYRYGPAPATPTGNTVIAGHVDTAADGPGALFRLRDAVPGTRIEIEDASGTVHRYEVAGKESIVKAELPVDQIFARDGRPLLVLVTCGGEYQPELRSYRDNVVVTAVPVTA